MNNKILSVVLVAGIATTGFTAISSANDSATGSIFSGNKAEIRELIQKVKSGEELSAEDQAIFDEAKVKFSEKKGERGFKGFGKRSGFKHLTDEEKTALESMTDEEKQAFFEDKKEEMKAKMQAHKEVIDALIAGETLTAAQEATRLEMIAKMEESDGKHRGDGEARDIIAKVLAGDELTSDEQTKLEEMQAKRAERQAERAKIEAMTDEEREAYFETKKEERKAKMEELKPLFEKARNGEELTVDEQALVDEAKSQFKGERRHSEGGHKGERGERNHGDDSDREHRGGNFR